MATAYWAGSYRLQGWPDGKSSGEPGEPTSDARITLHGFPNHP